MAFRNFMGMPNNYCVIVIEGYDKKSRSLSFKVRIYEDSSKKTVVAEIPYDFKVHWNEYLWAVDKLNTPPESPEDGDCYLIGDSPTGEWTSRSGALATYKNNKWNLVDHAEGVTLYLDSTSQVLVRNSDFGWDVFEGEYAPDIWDNYFDPLLFEQSNYNMLKAMYEYVKTLPEFAGIVDI